MVFQMTPGTEAPAEMNTWFPQFKALWMAENTTNTMHNVLTLRGAQVRDPLKWATYIDETIDLWGNEVQVKFQSHHWPQWGNAGIVEYFGKQRDIYKYTHDQSVRLMNMGYTGEEISEMIKLPASLENEWSVRGYYGTLRHNSRAVYQRYMGWYNGNPSDLNNLPPEMVAPRYVKAMGGEAEVIRKGQEAFEQNDYRWVAEVMKHVVFANPKASRPRTCWPTPTSSSATRPSPVRGARSTCRARSSCAMVCPKPARPIQRRRIPSGRCRPACCSIISRFD